MSLTLFHTLVRTSLATTKSDWTANARQQLSSATDLEWQQSLAALELHRLTQQTNAMLVHLIFHLDGHRSDTGPLLC